MATGIVKFFDSRSEKRFGFIIQDGMQDLFFHFNDGVFPEIDPYTHEVLLKEKIVRNGEHLPDPKKGDELVFRINQYGFRGDKASPWTTKELYDRAVVAAKEMPEPPTYRVMYLMKTTENRIEKPEIKWEGKDLRQLPREFSRPSYGQSPTSDPFTPYSDPDGNFSVRRWFEKEINGVFVECGDPRPR